MGVDGVKVGVRTIKYVIIATRMCYRSICNHPFVVGIILLLLFLYRSFPYLFAILVSSSPVLVCTAVLLGALLSFGDPNTVSESEEDGKSSCEMVELKTGKVVNTVVEEDGCVGKNSRYTELGREFVKAIDEEPLLENSDKLDKSGSDHDENDICFSSMSIDRNLSEAEKQWIDVAKNQQENMQDNQEVELADPEISHEENFQTGFPAGEKVQAEQSEDYISAEGSIDFQRDYLVSSLELQKRSDGDLAQTLLSAKNLEDYKSADGSVDAQTSDQLEPSVASWKQFGVLDDQLSAAQEVQEERCLGYSLAEGSSEAQMRDYIESSLRSWEQMDSYQDDDIESDSGSDGAESSSPDASMVDIIPMLDELHPLLDEENPQASKLSRQSSSAASERSAISADSSIHSDDESDQKDGEIDNVKSDADDDNEEGDQGGDNDPGKSAIMWTEDDQKNLMDLGTSELERNQRLESLIARRRARKMIGDGNLIDLDGMDLPFPVATISTKRKNPFDYPQDSYADLGLPPIPGSAPSIMLARRNPFDLPYDSSEEKPDLMGDSFQQEFMELTHREAFNQREALFRRNETFNLGSSGFDLGRPSRFRPYFVPERTDSDMMSYSSLQRQSSELSESKASSVAETELTYVGADLEEKKLPEHDSAQEVEPSEIDNASVVVEHGSQSFEDFEDFESLSGEEKVNKGYVLSEVEAELGGAWSSHVADSEVMRNSSLQRNLSGQNESKTSSVPEEDSNSLGAEQEEKQVLEDVSAQDMEHSSVIDFEEQGSQSSEALSSLSDEENEKKDFANSVLEVELGRVKSAVAAASFTAEIVSSADNSLDYREIYPAAEPLLSYNKVSHSDTQSTTELIESNHNICSSPLSEPHIHTDEKSDDVNRYMLNRENNQVNNLVSVDIPVKYSPGSSVSDVTTGLSLETSEDSLAAQEDDDHSKDPIYDWSPLKPNHSLSSSSSDLQRETSGLDIYQLSRNLFVVEESNVHNQDLENISKHTNQDDDSKGLIMNDFAEGRVLDSTDFSELNQLPGNSQTLVLAEEQGHLSTDSSDREAKYTVSDDKSFPHEAEHIMAKEDGADIHSGNKLANERNFKDMPSAYRQELMEDSVKEKNEAVVLLDNLSPVHTKEVEFEDKIDDGMIVDQQFQVSTYSLKYQENETLLSSQDENQYLPHGTDIHDPLSDLAEQEQTIIQRKHEVFDQINKVDEPVTFLMGADPQQETLSDPGQGNVSSCKAEDSETASISELAIKEHVQDVLETRHACRLEEDHEIYDGFEGCIADEHILNEDQNDLNEIDEELLAELDAVGEFRVSDIIPVSENSMIDPHAAFNSNISAEVTSEVHTGTEMPANDKALIGDSSPVINFESEGKHTRNNLSRTTEMELDSHTGCVSTDLLDLEAQAVENVDYVFKIVSEEVQKSIDSLLAEFPAKEIEAPLTTELLSEDTEAGGCTSEATLKADVVFNSSESVPDILQSDLALLDSDKGETVSGKPILDAEIIKQSGEDNEKVEAESDISGTAEALQAVAETGDDPMESMPLQIERDFKSIEKSPLLEASTALVVEHNDGNIKDAQEFSVLVASDTLSLETEDVKEALTMPVLDASVAPAVESENIIGSNTSEQLPLGIESKEIQESLDVGVGIGSALNTEHQSEKIDFMRSESLPIEEAFKEAREFTSHEGSSTPASEYEGCTGEIGSPEPLQLDRNIYEIEESPVTGVSIPLVLEPEENKAMVSDGEPKPLQSNKIIEELHDWHVVDGTGPIELEPLQTYTDIKEIQKSSTAKTSIPVANSEDQILTVNSEEPELLPIDRNFGELQESPAVEAKVTLAVESEGQLERVGLVELESLQMDRDQKETQKTSALQTSHASAAEFRDQMESNTLMEDIGVQAVQDHQLDSQQQLKVDVPKAGDSRGMHGDSSSSDSII